MDFPPKCNFFIEVNLLFNLFLSNYLCIVVNDYDYRTMLFYLWNKIFLLNQKLVFIDPLRVYNLFISQSLTAASTGLGI